MSANPKIVFSAIVKPYIHGWTASLGFCRVEVIRSYAGEWNVFHYQNENMVRGINVIHRSLSAAKKSARLWLISGAVLASALNPIKDNGGV